MEYQNTIYTGCPPWFPRNYLPAARPYYYNIEYHYNNNTTLQLDLSLNSKIHIIIILILNGNE